MNAKQSYCTFYLDNLYLGIEVSQVQEVIRDQQMTRVPLAPNAIRGLMNLRGQIVTALDLRQRLGLEAATNGRPAMNVVVRHRDSAVSLLVDRIGDVLDTDPDAFEPPPETLRGVPRELIRGACKLDGRLLLILDTKRVIELAA
ncbi:chemotaxis protein CheW [bacterium]|nr:chemotaxis protein CheW [bacterium]